MSGSTRDKLMMKAELVKDLKIKRCIPETSKWSKISTVSKLRNQRFFFAIQYEYVSSRYFKLYRTLLH